MFLHGILWLCVHVSTDVLGGFHFLKACEVLEATCPRGSLAQRRSLCAAMVQSS